MDVVVVVVVAGACEPFHESAGLQEPGVWIQALRHPTLLWIVEKERV